MSKCGSKMKARKIGGDSTAVDFLNAKVDDTTGLCLSGGGYRAMLYHVGAVLRMNEMGLLPKISKIASVSGGSITAGQLAMSWDKLQFDKQGVAGNIVEEFAKPLMQFAKIGVDVKAVILGTLLPDSSSSKQVANALDEHLFKGAELSDLPDSPQFIFMATNLQTKKGFGFSKDYALDYRVGKIERPVFRLARVVGASAAYPPFLSPVTLDFKENEVEATPGADLHLSPYIDKAVLSDGGIRNNLGTEPIWSHCYTILVSNAGLAVPDIGQPSGRVIGQTSRSILIMQDELEHLLETILTGLDAIGQRKVAMWKIGTPVTGYEVADPLPLTKEETAAASSIRTRLNPFTDAEINLLLRTGYADADASLRARGLAKNDPLASFSNLPRADHGKVSPYGL